MSFMAQNLYHSEETNENEDLSDISVNLDPFAPVNLSDVYTQPEHWILGNNRPIERL